MLMPANSQTQTPPRYINTKQQQQRYGGGFPRFLWIDSKAATTITTAAAPQFHRQCCQVVWLSHVRQRERERSECDSERTGCGASPHGKSCAERVGGGWGASPLSQLLATLVSSLSLFGDQCVCYSNYYFIITFFRCFYAFKCFCCYRDVLFASFFFSFFVFAAWCSPDLP